ncbi:hypothetical protein MMC34_005907 [Xylographa carneopallida]|nr:hypothetical protein [Xylographa carneopallida]
MPYLADLTGYIRRQSDSHINPVGGNAATTSKSRRAGATGAVSSLHIPFNQYHSRAHTASTFVHLNFPSLDREHSTTVTGLLRGSHNAFTTVPTLPTQPGARRKEIQLVETEANQRGLRNRPQSLLLGLFQVDKVEQRARPIAPFATIGLFPILLSPDDAVRDDMATRQRPIPDAQLAADRSPDFATPSLGRGDTRLLLPQIHKEAFTYQANPSSSSSRETVPLPIESQPRPFLIYHDSFLPLIGAAPTLTVLIDDARAPYFHDAGVFDPRTNTLFVTSNLLPDPAPDAIATAHKTIVTTRLEFFSPTDFARDKVRCPERPHMMAAGGTNYRDGLILCAQGSLREPAGLVYMEAKRPHRTCSLLNNYHARPFNSPRAAAVHSDGSVWFTDPADGFARGFRPKPQLPQHVYRFEPATGDVRAVADGFARPAGIAFAPDERTLYVSDTDAVRAGPGPASAAWDPTRAATIYAFSLLRDPATQAPFLANRRVFAHADAGVPDSVHCDVHGNVYAGCGDGVNVWNSGGTLIGKILIEGGVASFCFGKKGELWAFGEKKLWRVQLAEGTMGALLKI